MSIAEMRQSADQKMQKSIEALKTSLARIRTGRAHAGILDHVQVDYYGSPVPISQVANVTLVDARTIGVAPWEKKMAPVIEKAIRDSGLGLNPMSLGDLIRIPMPPLSEERRRELAKVVKSEGFATFGARPTSSSRSCSRTRPSPRTRSAARRMMCRSSPIASSPRSTSLSEPRNRRS